MESFYTRLNHFRDFGAVAERKHYVRCPPDWYVVMTDIQGSTKAIEEGRYRDVNLMGAAAIVAIQNVFQERVLPFSFGGDGATILVPDERLDEIKTSLLKLKRLSETQFNLPMRVGVVPVRLLDEKDKPMLVAKFELAPGNYLAMFQGGGAQLAEKWIKSSGPNGENFRVESADLSDDPDLTNLSCRWSPIASKNGHIISLLVMAVDSENADRVYADVIRDLDPVLRSEAAAPVRAEDLKLGSIFEIVKKDLKLQRSRGLFRVVLENLIRIAYIRLSMAFGKSPGGQDIVAYVKDNPTNSDYKKFDDMLRMVIDCNDKQRALLSEILEKKRLAGEIYYGTHRSDTALMTCVVHSLSENQHVHFIDGNDGGYALAAKMLKEQIKASGTKQMPHVEVAR